MRLTPRIRAILLVFSVVLSLAVFAPSESSGSSGELLTYSELMRLSPEKRREYISGVREILIDLSKDPKARFSDSDPNARSKLKAWIEWIDRNGISSAVADDSEVPCGANKQCLSALKSCFGQNASVRWADGVYYCDPSRPIPNEMRSRWNDIVAGAPDPSTKPGGTAPILSPELLARRAQNAQAIAAASAAIGDGEASPTVGGGASGAEAPPPIPITPPAGQRSTYSLTGQSRARTLSEFANLVAAGGVQGVSIPCRSKHQTANQISASGKATDTSALPACADAQERALESAFRKSRGALAGVVEQGSQTSAAGQAPAAAPADVKYELLSRKISKADYEKIIADAKAKGVSEEQARSGICDTEGTKLAPGQKVFFSADGDENFYCATTATFDALRTGKMKMPEEKDERPVAKLSRHYKVADVQKAFSEKKDICELEREFLGVAKGKEIVFAKTSDTGGHCISKENLDALIAKKARPPTADELKAALAEFEARKTGNKAPAAVGTGVSPQPQQSPKPGPPTAPATAAATVPVESGTCTPKPATCESREAIRDKYYQGNLPCIFAGMISKLDGGNRKCTAVTSFEIGGTKLSCEHGQSMCNPLLFGAIAGNASQAICVGRGQNVTQQCSKISNARNAEIFLNRNVAGLQDKWDEFKNGLDNVCKPDSISAKFHCVECNTMRHRLHELHAKLVGNPCETTISDGIKIRIREKSAPVTR